MTAMDIVISGIIYFSCIFIFIGLLNSAGAFTTQMSTTYGKVNLEPNTEINKTSTSIGNTLNNGKSYFGVIFSFFLWNIEITDGFFADYLLPIKIIFVWIPLIALLVAFYYSLPISSGGG